MNGHRLLLSGLAAACAVLSSGAQARDFSVLEHDRIANEGAIASEWQVADGALIAAPAFPAEFAHTGAPNACIALGYRINPDGTTSDFLVLKQWNEATGSDDPQRGFNAAVATAARAAVAQWKFAPREGHSTAAAVDTVATMSFNANRGMAAADLRRNCEIPDLAAFYNDQYDDRDLVTDRLERRQYFEQRALRRAVAETPEMAATRMGFSAAASAPQPAAAPVAKPKP